MTGTQVAVQGAAVVPNERPISDVLGGELNSLAVLDKDRNKAIEAIRSGFPAEVLRDALAELEAQQHGGEDPVDFHLKQLMAVFHVPDRGDAEWVVWWSAYFEDLAELPGFAIGEACKRYRRKKGAEHFPKPGELRALALEAASPLYTAIGRLRQALKPA